MRVSRYFNRLVESFIQAEFAELGRQRSDIERAYLSIVSEQRQQADHLLMTTRAANLLGSRVVLVGIGAEIAQTIVHIGMEDRG